VPSVTIRIKDGHHFPGSLIKATRAQEKGGKAKGMWVWRFSLPIKVSGGRTKQQRYAIPLDWADAVEGPLP
jgi:hypothetical protein|tara:strand:+ start:945 stop:1157 length:213 start_codon:yes stop_codon:yes gene_type:complete